jgi:maltose O-acetyltransferase
MIKAEIKQFAKDTRAAFFNFPVNVMASSNVTPRLIRSLIYRRWGIGVRTNSIAAQCFFGSKNVSIGQGTFVNRNCFFDAYAPIEIGNYCSIGMDVLFCTSSHDPGTKHKRAGQNNGKPIKIGDGSWIGARSTILQGVTVGEGCIIAAGSLVNKDCEPNGLYAGVPAKRIKDLPVGDSLDAQALPEVELKLLAQ